MTNLFDSINMRRIDAAALIHFNVDLFLINLYDREEKLVASDISFFDALQQAAEPGFGDAAWTPEIRVHEAVNDDNDRDGDRRAYYRARIAAIMDKAFEDMKAIEDSYKPHTDW